MFRQISMRNLVFPHIIIMFKLLIYMCGGRNADDSQEPETLLVSVEFGLSSLSQAAGLQRGGR